MICWSTIVATTVTTARAVHRLAHRAVHHTIGPHAPLRRLLHRHLLHPTLGAKAVATATVVSCIATGAIPFLTRPTAPVGVILVPEPSSLWVFGTAVAILVIIRSLTPSKNPA
jgi:hypothetical protein